MRASTFLTGYGTNPIYIPIFLGPDTVPAATASNFTIINDSFTDTVRLLGTTSPTSGVYVLYSGGPTNTQFWDNVTGSQFATARRNRTYIIGG